ncbi:MAG: hypothetical protein P8Y43_07390 [Sulfurovaceae bacterium]
MSKHESNSEMTTQHIMEIRYTPSGGFLDTRGYLADYIREGDILPHWQIEENVIHFRDDPREVQEEGAFIGYKNSGYIVYDPETKNYFSDKTKKFWKLFSKNKEFIIPELSRVGIRSKIFIPIKQEFDFINHTIASKIYSSSIDALLGSKMTDSQFVFTLNESQFQVRIMGGPIHKEEAYRLFDFSSDAFEKCGLFLDIDVATTSDLTISKVTSIIDKSMEITWKKIDSFAKELGI